MSGDKQQSFYLQLQLAGQVVMLPIHQVQIVIPIAELQKIPDEDSSFAGILNYHGQNVPVYHLSELVNQTRPEYDLDTPLILCCLDNELLGLLVHKVISIYEIADTKIQKPKLKSLMSYIAGIYEEEKFNAWILDLQQLVAFHELNLRTHKHDQ